MVVTVMVSGCFEILHAGHLAFLRDARSLGDRLIVSAASDESLWQHKRRRPAIAEIHRKLLLEALVMVDHVVMSKAGHLGLDFEQTFRELKPNILAVTEDDRYGDIKRQLCDEIGARYVVLPKHRPASPLSTTQIRQALCIPRSVPLRVDFAGGWLDVPALAREGAYVVNASIVPSVSLNDWPYPVGAGLGGSAARLLLAGNSAIEGELALGAGWQDPAIICETGLCVWRSGAQPSLELKSDGRWLRGRMAILQVGASHHTPSLVNRLRPYELIEAAGAVAYRAVRDASLVRLMEAVRMSYEAQLEEGMTVIEGSGAQAWKYCGAGWGGFALFLFEHPEARELFLRRHPAAIGIEPYCQLRTTAPDLDASV